MSIGVAQIPCGHVLARYARHARGQSPATPAHYPLGTAGRVTPMGYMETKPSTNPFAMATHTIFQRLMVTGI
jgi:hypothetical protein